jgi:hypothetical protein
LAGKDKKIVHLDHWREFASPRIDAESPDAKQKAFKRARAKFFDSKLVANFNDYWWPI